MRILKRFYITNYKNYLVDNSYEPATINKKVNSIGAFNNFLIARGYMQENVIDLKKDRVKIAAGSEHQVEVYSDSQLERIQFYIQNQKKVSLRDKMIIQLLMFTGVRVSEICGIKLKNIDFLMSQIKIIGKGGKVREVPVKFEVMDTIQKYISERNNNPYKDSEYLILGQRGAIRRDAVNTLLERHTLKGNFDWDKYNIEQYGSICVMEDTDNPKIINTPKFATIIEIGGTEYYKIVISWDDDSSIVVFSAANAFGEEFGQYINQFVID